MIEYAVLGGFVLDCLFGDPAWLPHPVVYMGKAISALEKRLRARLPKTPQGELLGGAIVAFCLPGDALAHQHHRVRQPGRVAEKRVQHEAAQYSPQDHHWASFVYWTVFTR